MTKTYSKKESVKPYYFLLALGVAVIIFGLLLANYFAWQAFPLLGIAIFKISNISKNSDTPVIELSDEGLKILAMFSKPLLEQPFYEFSKISSIQLKGISHYGHLRLKESNKKILLDSSGISAQDKDEIISFVEQRIQ